MIHEVSTLGKLVDIQELLLDLDETNILNTLECLDSSYYEPPQIIRNILLLIRIRPRNIHSYASLCELVIRKLASNENEYDLKRLILEYPSSNEYFYFISLLVENSLFSYQEISNIFKLSEICWFRNIFSHDTKLFEELMNNFQAKYPMDFEHFSNLNALLKMENPDPIAVAIRNDDITAVQSIDVNQKIRRSVFEIDLLNDECTIIQYAAFHGSIKSFSYLVDNGADIYVKDLKERNLFYFIVAGNSLNIFKLMTSNIDIESIIKASIIYHKALFYDIYAVSIPKETYPELFVLSCKAGNAYVINKILEQEIPTNFIKEGLSAAIEGGNYDVAKILINYSDGSNLLSAIDHHFNDIAELMFNHNEEFVNYQEKRRFPLLSAIEHNNMKMIEMLCSSYIINSSLCNSDGNNALLYAISKQKIEIVYFLLEHLVFDINSTNNQRESALLIAVKLNQAELVTHLLNIEKIDVNCQDSNGYSPLMWAAWKGETEICAKLLDHPAIDVNIQDNFGCTPLIMAAWTNNIEEFKMLAHHPEVDFQLRDADGNNAFTIAASNGCMKICDFIYMNRIQ